jgi:hypothetical protein
MYHRRSTAFAQYPWLEAIVPRDIDTQAGALRAARASWLGAAWLAANFALSLLSDVLFPASYVFLTIDGSCLALMTWLAWMLRRRQPRWAIVTVLVMLCLVFLLQLVSLRFNIFMIITVWLVYLTAHALRGAYRVVAYLRGQRVDNEKIADVFQ